MIDANGNENCSNCVDCVDCYYCVDCVNCVDCKDSTSCVNCVNCELGTCLNNCKNCADCSYMIDCQHTSVDGQKLMNGSRIIGYKTSRYADIDLNIAYPDGYWSSNIYGVHNVIGGGEKLT